LGYLGYRRKIYFCGDTSKNLIKLPVEFFQRRREDVGLRELIPIHPILNLLQRLRLLQPELHQRRLLP
jgi:hypothetical protein